MDSPQAPPSSAASVSEAQRAVEALAEVADEAEAVSYRRDRLLSSLVFIAGVGLFLATPFALRAGAIFFMPVAVAIVITLMLVPAQEWMERHRVPSGLGALIVLLLFLFIANATLVAIVLPATEWVQLLPSRTPQIRQNLEPILAAFASLERLIEQVTGVLSASGGSSPTEVVVNTPNSALDLLTASAPAALVQTLFAILLVYFLLAAYTRMRVRIIRNRSSLSGSLRVARLIRDTVQNTASYLLTITMINASLGAVVALTMWLVGMPTPLMWGGFAAILNFVPYLGPVIASGLIAFGGLVAFSDPWAALTPAALFVLIHTLEANAVTPALVGKRLEINPLAILLSLSFWGWVWGTVGALISVPLLIMFKVILDRVGTPDILGFLFDEQTLAESHHDDAPHR
ncbi:MAG: AI-2E family transporter [Sphingomonadaceae bacterium]|nr:AI-2E family transporter [Sphingomonadaceae bacterium]